ncbi:hypothetical protein O3M35_010531 [Rhynocoris fuscipes]|uniref:Uncharacterized protein n=1 Tax=Rhynocoris fuscipes TaxID=488301 RepID=A0AAW1D0L9_9HEMI
MESNKNFTNDLECHFNWNIRSIVGEKEVVDKLKEKNEEIAGQPWRNLLITLTTAYELYMKKDSGATEKLHEAITMWGNSDDDFTMKYKDAFRHVIYSVKLFFVKDNSSFNVVKQIYDYIPPYSTLPIQQKVAITAIKANVFSEYGPNGTKHALELAKEAVRKDPDEGEWSFLVGKMLSRIRNFKFDFCVTEEELESLRRAYALSKSPAHGVFLAQTYCSISKALFNKLPLIRGKRMMNGDEGRIIRSYNEKAYDLFNEALRENNDKCTHINFRCAKGFYNLPGQFKDITKALSIVEKTLERAPTNVYGNMVAGNIYYAIGEVDKAFKHMKAAEEGGSYGSSIKQFTMAYEQHLKMNPEKEYEEIFKKHPEITYKIQTCMHAISFYIFKRHDLYSALKYFFMAAEWDATLDDFYCYIYWIKETTDLCFIVYNEVKCAMEDVKRNDKRFPQLKNAIIIVNTKYPKVTERPLKPNFVNFLINRAPKYFNKKIKQTTQKKNRKILIEKSDWNENKTKNVDNSGNKNNVLRKKKQNGKQSYERRQKERRNRTNSVSSNASVSSVSSVASTGSFKNIRRNSREACLLDIVNKNLERESHCKNMKELKETQCTSLRPVLDNSKTINVGPDSKERRPLSLGCSGWTNKSNENLSNRRTNTPKDKPNYSKNKFQQSRDVTHMNEMFKNMKLNNSQELRPNISPFNDKFKSDGRNTNFMNYGNRNKAYNRSSSFSDNEFKSNSRKSDYSGSPNKTVSKSFRSSLENVANKDSSYFPKFNSGRSSPFNPSRGNSQTREKGLVRKPFNLSRTDSLDSDDSSSFHGSERSRKLSTSSVDSDYVKDPNVPYFSWHKNYSGKK